MNISEGINSCTDIDDYRPIQSTLLTRFTTNDCSDYWRTTNQDYGAFYYRENLSDCEPDNLKSKISQRYDRFQDWLLYQTSSSFNTNNNNNQSIFPSNRNETIKITHRKKFTSTCNDNQNMFSLCGQAGLITGYIVKKILNKLQNLIQSDEYQDVLQCAQILVSEILTQEPTLSTNDIIERVIAVMLTPPDNIQQSMSKPCSSQHSMHELPLNTTVSTTGPFINSNETVYEKLTNLENAISKISNHVMH